MRKRKNNTTTKSIPGLVLGIHGGETQLVPKEGIAFSGASAIGTSQAAPYLLGSVTFSLQIRAISVSEGTGK